MIEGACLCGAVRWSFEGLRSRPRRATARPAGATGCFGRTTTKTREYASRVRRGPISAGKHLGFHFCPDCGCVAYWRGLAPGEDGRRRIAVNLRLAEPEAVAAIVIDHFDGLETFEDLPRDGRCVRDYWF